MILWLKEIGGYMEIVISIMSVIAFIVSLTAFQEENQMAIVIVLMTVIALIISIVAIRRENQDKAG
jgi:L-asparagine transporter-like permease